MPVATVAGTQRIAFLRAINVGGRTVRMEQLRALFEGLGFAGVETFIASGNVVFETASRSGIALERKIEGAFLKAFGFESSVFVRTTAEVAAVAAHTPFRSAKPGAAVALNVGFLREPLDAQGVKTLATFKTAIDDFHSHGCEVYWLCHKKQSESRFTGAAFEKTLGVRATFRSITTVRRLADKYPPR